MGTMGRTKLRINVLPVRERNNKMGTMGTMGTMGIQDGKL